MTDKTPLVLIVEDDEDISRALTIRLEAEGFEVRQAFDAVLAMDAARKYQPDLAVLDISMPGGDGIQVAHRMRALDETKNTQIVFLTASKRPDLREGAAQVGAAAFFEKPYDAKELIAKVHSLLGTTLEVE